MTVLALAAPLITITITTIHRQGSRCPAVRLAQVPPNSAIPLPASDEVSRGEPAGCPKRLAGNHIHAVPLEREEQP